MKLGICSNWGDDTEAYRTEVRTAAELDYGIVGIGDSPAGWRDLIVSMTLASMDAPKATIASMVTSPFMRHPLVTANAFSTLEEIAPGRVALGLATGGSTVVAIGRNRATQKQIREEFDALQALFRGDATEFEGRPVSHLRYPAKVPIYYSAFGPKALALAGERADGAILFASAQNLPELRERIAAVRAGAEAAGRNPDDVDIWVISFASVRPTREESIEDLKAFIAVNALTICMAPEKLAETPEELRPKIVEFGQRYDVSAHVKVGGPNTAMMDELGLTDYLSQFDTTMGTVEETAEVLRQVADMGASAFIAALPGHAAPLETIRGLAAARDAM